GALADGLVLHDIALKLKVSYPTALKYRRKIAALTIKLGISPPRYPEPIVFSAVTWPDRSIESSAASLPPWFSGLAGANGDPSVFSEGRFKSRKPSMFGDEASPILRSLECD